MIEKKNEELEQEVTKTPIQEEKTNTNEAVAEEKN